MVPAAVRFLSVSLLRNYASADTVGDFCEHKDAHWCQVSAIAEESVGEKKVIPGMSVSLELLSTEEHDATSRTRRNVNERLYYAPEKDRSRG